MFDRVLNAPLGRDKEITYILLSLLLRELLSFDELSSLDESESSEPPSSSSHILSSATGLSQPVALWLLIAKTRNVEKNIRQFQPGVQGKCRDDNRQEL